MLGTLREFYLLTKPGIVRGNAFSTTAGFFLATKGGVFDFGLFAATIAGISLVIASGCVFNNVIDKDIDKKMTRTKNRALVTGRISEYTALFYGLVLGISGISLLAFIANPLTALVALAGFIFYVVIYGLAKRAGPYGTLVGSISGAIPPVVGYTAVSNTIDTAALLLFAILTAWQMPHFYAIAMYRLKDYTAAGIPVLPAAKGIKTTKIRIIGYIVLFIIAALLLSIFDYTGLIYTIPVTIVGLVWLYRGAAGLKTQNDIKWAKQMFGFSLLVLLTFCGSIVIDSIVA